MMDEDRGMPISATAGNLDALLSAAPRLALVDFWAPWCAPCRALSPVLEDVAIDYAGRVAVMKVNVEAEPDLGARFAVSGLPLMILFDHGRERRRLVGAMSRTRLAAILDVELARAPA